MIIIGYMLFILSGDDIQPEPVDGTIYSKLEECVTQPRFPNTLGESPKKYQCFKVKAEAITYKVVETK